MSGQMQADAGEQFIVKGFIRAVAILAIAQDWDVVIDTQHLH